MAKELYYPKAEKDVGGKMVTHVADLKLEEDGLPGPTTSEAFQKLTGYKLAREV